MLVVPLAAAIVLAALALGLADGRAQQPPNFPTLISGTITRDSSPVSGGTVGAAVGGSACMVGGMSDAVASNGTFNLVVFCAAGSAIILYNGTPTNLSLMITPGGSYTGQQARPIELRNRIRLPLVAKDGS